MENLLPVDPTEAVMPNFPRAAGSRVHEFPDDSAIIQNNKPSEPLGIVYERLDPATISSIMRSIIIRKDCLPPQKKLAVYSPNSVELMTAIRRSLPDVDFVSGNFMKCNIWLGYYNKNKPPLPPGINVDSWIQVGTIEREKAPKRTTGDPGPNARIDLMLMREQGMMLPISKSPNNMVMPPHVQPNPLDPGIRLFSSTIQKPSNRIQITSSTLTTPEEVRTDIQRLGTESSEFSKHLPFLASTYKISSNPDDYFMKPVIMFHTDIPNRNGYVFPTSSMIEWNPTLHCMGYQSWRYAPLHIEHKTDDPFQAIGIIADVVLKKATGVCGGNIYKVIALAAVDRTKNPSYTSQIENDQINSWSMGCDATRIYCSYCGATQGECSHLDPEAMIQFYVLNGSIVCRAASGLSGKELSSVGTPAWAMAVSADGKLTF